MREPWPWRPAPAAVSFGATRQKLAEVKREHDGLSGERERQMRALTANRQQQQLIVHLEGFELATAKISGLGKAKIATLLSYGIETVADFDPARLAAVPGFGPKTIASMLVYRKQCEASFSFDASRSVASSAIANLDTVMAQRRAKMEVDLKAGLATLKVIASTDTLYRQSLAGRAAELRPLLAQALADASEMGITG